MKDGISSLRVLVMSKIEEIRGGVSSPDAIIVTGLRLYEEANGVVTVGYEHDSGIEPNPTIYNGDGSGGIVVYSSYYNLLSSTDANGFAYKHIQNHGVTDMDEHYYELAYDALAKFYDFARQNAATEISIANNETMIASTALTQFNNLEIDINPLRGGYTGANTTVDDDYIKGLIQINTSNTEQQGWQLWGDAGINYVIFHELGHYLNAGGRIHFEDEAAANTAGRSLESDLHITTMQDDEVPFGFD